MNNENFPVNITEQDFRTKWEPDGWKIIHIGPTSNWRPDWTMWEGIREVVQNCLDETERYQSYYDDLGLVIADSGKGIATRDLLLGAKVTKPAWSRGQYGEGMKIGSLVFLRMGYPVWIETVGKDIRIVFMEVELEEKAQTLAAMWRPGGTTYGTKFHIIGYTDTDYKENFAVNIPQEYIRSSVWSILQKSPIGRKNQLMLIPDRSCVFARDIYMRDIESQFSYNLWGFDLAPDRHAPKDESDMWNDASRTWCGCTDTEMMKLLLKSLSSPQNTGTPYKMSKHGHIESGIRSNDSNLNLSSWNLGRGYDFYSSPPAEFSYKSLVEHNKFQWLQAWNTVFGESAILRTNSGLDTEVTHMGHRSVSILGGLTDVLNGFIDTDDALIKRFQRTMMTAMVIEDSDLSPKQLVTLNLCRALVEANYSSNGIFAAIVPESDDVEGVRAYYEPSTKKIFIGTATLEHTREAISATIHEVAHMTSEAGDGKPAHYNAISDVASRFIFSVKYASSDTSGSLRAAPLKDALNKVERW